MSTKLNNNSYWRASASRQVISSSSSALKSSPIVIVGAGLAGVSIAYHLLSHLDTLGLNPSDILLVDNGTEHASYHRNCGHILWGMGENYRTIKAVNGDMAKNFMALSERYTLMMEEVIKREAIACNYKKGNYFVIPKNEQEARDLADSLSIMYKDGIFGHKIASQKDICNLGINAVGDGIVCSKSASAHPSDFRNALLDIVIKKGVSYHTGREAIGISENTSSGGSKVRWKDLDSETSHDIVILATNAYMKHLSGVESLSNKIEPFKGQIIASKPLKGTKLDNVIFSSDHGYIYGHFTTDNRILLGGWRNNVAGGEIGKTDLSINDVTEKGLMNTAKYLFNFKEKIEWEYSWAGIMGSSHNGRPIVGGVSGNGSLFTASGFTGYGFGYAFGTAKDLVDMIVGNAIDAESVKALAMMRP